MSTWESLSFRDRALMTLDMFPSLSDDIKDDVVAQWSDLSYDDTWIGQQQAIADLLGMLRWASMSPEQRREERVRIAKDRKK